MPNVKSPSISSNNLNFAELNRWLSTQKDHKKITVEIGKHGQCVLGTESNTVLHRLARGVRPDLLVKRTRVQAKLMQNLKTVGDAIHADLLNDAHDPYGGVAWDKVKNVRGLTVGDLRQHIQGIAKKQREMEDRSARRQEKEARESIFKFHLLAKGVSRLPGSAHLLDRLLLPSSPGADPVLKEGHTHAATAGTPGAMNLLAEIGKDVAALQAIGDLATSDAVDHRPLDRHLAQKTVRALGHGATRKNFGSRYVEGTEPGDGPDPDLTKGLAAINAVTTLLGEDFSRLSAPLAKVVELAISDRANELTFKLACKDVLDQTEAFLSELVKLATTLSAPTLFEGMPTMQQVRLQQLGRRLFDLVKLIIAPDQPHGEAYLLALRGIESHEELVSAIKAHTPKPVGADGQARPPAGPVGAEPVDPHEVLDDLLASLENDGLMAPARPPLQAPLSPLDLDALDAELDSLMKS